MNLAMAGDLLRKKIDEIFPGNHPFCVLQVGANDGKSFDPLFEILQRKNCKAYLLEPIHYLFSELCSLHASSPRVTCINTAISETNGRCEISYVDPKVAHSWQRGIGSLYTNFHTFSETPSEFMVREMVPSSTFENLFLNYGISGIDVLVTDCEGFDPELINLFPFHQESPKLIQIELDRNYLTPQLCASTIETLIMAGYHNFSTDGDDLVAWKEFE